MSDLRKLDADVAVEVFGYYWVVDTRGEDERQLWHPGNHLHSVFKRAKGDEPVAMGDVGGFARNYSTCPQALQAVKDEIVRRGWGWRAEWAGREGDYAAIVDYAGSSWVADMPTEAEALCRAVLAAVRPK